MKKHNLFKIILICLITFMIATWIIPTSEGTSIGSNLNWIGIFNLNRIGIFNLLNSIVTSLRSFIPYAVFVIMVAVFYLVLNKTGLYGKLIDLKYNVFKKKKDLAVILTIIFFAIISSVTNYGILLFIIIPFAISVLTKMGYDKLVCLSATFGAIFVGIIGSTIGYNVSYSITSVLKISLYDNIISRILILIISTGLLILFTMSYIKKTKGKKNEDLVVTDKLYIEEEATKDKKKSVWPLAIMFYLLIIVVVLTATLWEPLFGVKCFSNFYNWVMGIKIFGFELFKNIFGADLAGGYLAGAKEFGYMYYNDMSLLTTDLSFVLLISSLIIGLVYKVKFSEILTSFKDGAKKVAKPAFLILFALSLLILNYYVPIMNTIMISAAKSFNVITSSLVFVLASITNIDLYFFTNGNLNTYVTALGNTDLHSIINIMVQTMYGLASFVAPTSLILILGLSYLDVKYITWFKFIWKLLIEILVVVLIIILILMVI